MSAEEVREARANAADMAAQERAGAVARNVGVQSPGIIQAKHPEHGEAVVYMPGEMLPQWVVDALDGGRGHYDVASGAFVLDEPAPARKRGRS